MGFCPTTALAGAVPCLCVRGVRGWSGAGPVPRCVSPPLPSLFVLRGSRGVCGGLSRPGFPCPCLLIRHSMWFACSAVSVRWPFRFAPRALCVAVHAHSRVARALVVLLRPPPPPLPYARTARGLLAGRWWGHSMWSAPLCVSCSGSCSVVLFWGGVCGVPVPVPPSLLASELRRRFGCYVGGV